MKIIAFLALALLTTPALGAAVAATETRHGLVRGLHEQAGLPFWQWVGEGFSLTLVQRAPDQTRSFFEARGFDPKLSDLIAEQCVFKTIVANTDEQVGGSAVEYDLKEWRVVVGTERRSLAGKDEWDRRWQRLGVSRKARIAFRWALLPTRQRFEAGDHSWGMTSYGLPFGREFDLEFVWRRGDQRHVALIEGLRCALDAPVATGG